MGFFYSVAQWALHRYRKKNNFFTTIVLPGRSKLWPVNNSSLVRVKVPSGFAVCDGDKERRGRGLVDQVGADLLKHLKWIIIKKETGCHQSRGELGGRGGAEMN